MATIYGHPYSNIARTNLILNPRPASTAEWALAANASNLVLSGIASKYLGWTAAAAGGASIRQVDTISINGVSPISARVDCTTLNGPSTSRLARVQLRFFDSTGAQVGLVDGTEQWVTNPTFTTVKIENAIPPATATKVALYIVGRATAAGDQFYAQNILLEQASTAGSYFDGSTPDTTSPRVDYTWTGTPNASKSAMRTPEQSTIQPASVLAPWTAESESMSTLHAYMDRPSWAVVTWREPGPRQGTFDMLFDDVSDAYNARRILTTHKWFELDDTDYRYVPQFVLTPGQQLAYGQVQEGARVAATGKTRWHVVAPWTEVNL